MWQRYSEARLGRMQRRIHRRCMFPDLRCKLCKSSHESVSTGTLVCIRLYRTRLRTVMTTWRALQWLGLPWSQCFRSFAAESGQVPGRPPPCMWAPAHGDRWSSNPVRTTNADNSCCVNVHRLHVPGSTVKFGQERESLNHDIDAQAQSSTSFKRTACASSMAPAAVHGHNMLLAPPRREWHWLITCSRRKMCTEVPVLLMVQRRSADMMA